MKSRPNIISVSPFEYREFEFDFSETIAASDLKVGRCKQLFEFMKICEYLRSRSFLYQVLYVLCFTMPRYQVSVYKAIGPLVLL